MWVTLLVTLAFGLIGFWDDYLKLVVGNSRGLIARYKYFWQSVAGLGCAIALYMTAKSPAETALYVPLFKTGRDSARRLVRRARVFRRGRHQQRGESHRRSGWSGHHAGGSGGWSIGGVCLCDRQCGVLGLSRHSFHRGHR